MEIFVDASFYISWTLVPILLLSIIYQSINAFFGTIYMSSYHTKGVFKSSILGALLLIILNYLFPDLEYKGLV